MGSVAASYAQGHWFKYDIVFFSVLSFHARQILS